MPQMSPMIWVVFPLIMMFLVLLSLVTLEGETYENKEDLHEGKSEIKKVKW